MEEDCWSMALRQGEKGHVGTQCPEHSQHRKGELLNFGKAEKHFRHCPLFFVVPSFFLGPLSHGIFPSSRWLEKMFG